MAMVHVIAVITAKAGKREEILEAFRANVPAVHAEDGCIEYGATIDAEGVGSFQTKYGDDTFVARRYDRAVLRRRERPAWCLLDFSGSRAAISGTLHGR